MALSGEFKKTFSGNGNYWIRGIWSATQNTGANTSTVTLKTYFASKPTYSLYARGLRLTTWIDGKSSNTTHNISTGGGREILLNTRSVTITHNEDGTRKFDLHAIMDATMITVSGKNLGKADTGNSSKSLNSIPRKSTLSSAKSFTATNDYACTITRGNSSFTHTLTFKTGDRTLKSVPGIGASATIYFTEQEKIEMLKLVDGKGNTTITAELDTYNGSSYMGRNTYSITLKEPMRSTLSIPTWASIENSSNMPIEIGAYGTQFRHDIAYNIKGQTGYIYSNIAKGSYSYSLHQMAELFYRSFPDSANGEMTFKLTTKIGSYTRVNTESRVFSVPLTQKGPTIPDNAISYLDTNTSTVGVTKNNQFIIANKSHLRVNLDKLPHGKNHANIREYSVMIGGSRKVTTNFNLQSFDFGLLDLKQGDSITLTATDTRGVSSSRNFPCHIIEYDNPIVNLSGERVSNFESLTKISILCDYSPVIVAGTAKNSINYLRVRYKKATESAWSGWMDISMTQVGSKQVKGEKTLDLDNKFSYNIEATVGDALQATGSKTTLVQKGIPLAFIDTKMSSIGIGDFPKRENIFESYVPTATCQEIIMDYNSKDVSKNIRTWYSANNNTLFTEPSGATGGTTWSMEEVKLAPKSIGTNGDIWSRGNITGNSIDAVNDINAGKNIISGGNVTFKGAMGIAYGTDRAQWINTVKLANGAIVTKIGEETIAYNGNKVIWSGANPMGAGAIAWLPIKITECPTGICLVWSSYTAGTVRDYHFTITYFPKAFFHAHGQGRGVNQIIAADYGSNDPSNQIHKYIYFHDNKLEGHSKNTSDTKQQSLILRTVMVY